MTSMAGLSRLARISGVDGQVVVDSKYSSSVGWDKRIYDTENSGFFSRA